MVFGQQKDLHRLSVDYSLTSIKLLPQMCHLLLQNTGLVVSQGRQAPPPQHAALTVGLHADCYQPHGRLNINTKISLIDCEELWCPLVGCLPCCTETISWLEFPENLDAQWVRKRVEALHALPACTFKQLMTYQGVEYTSAVRVQFGCITADHHNLRSECKQKGFVACPWLNKHGSKDLFLHKGGMFESRSMPS